MQRQDALALKQTARTLRSAGCDIYLSLWKKAKPTGRTYPAKTGALLVTNVRDKRAWTEQYGKKTVGFISNGSPQFPGYSGYVRIGDKVFTYSTIRSEYHTHTYATEPIDTRSYNHGHVESTFDASPREVAALKAFYLARANGAILNPTTRQPHLPQWNNPGSSGWNKEGCAGAATSVLNPKWQRAFRFSIDNIRSVGQRLNIPELANATADMADAVASFTGRTGLKQCTTPKALVREYALHGKGGQKITILNAPNGEVPGNFKNLVWDQKHRRYDGDAGWNGLGKYPLIPDYAAAAKRSSAFRNVRLDPMAALDAALR